MKQPEKTAPVALMTEGAHMKGSKDERVRQCFRVPVKQFGEIVLKYGDCRYDVLNLSQKGLAVRLPEGKKSFKPSEILAPAQLKFEDQTIGLTVKVISFYVDEHGNQVCGLSVVDLSEEDTRRIDNFFWHLRKQLFRKE